MTCLKVLPNDPVFEEVITMKSRRWISVLLCLILVTGIFPILFHPANAADADRKALTDLLSELEKKIEKADERMVAHPKFLEELRALVQRYQSKLREVFLSEDFSDGDYKRNPTWVVDSGTFTISTSRRLLSEIVAERPTSTSSSKEESSPLGGLIKDIIRSTVETDEDESPTPTAGEARIHTLSRIGPAFEVDLTMVSRSSGGSMEVVLLGGDPPAPQYRMVYQSPASADRPIQIVRERGTKSYLIEEATHYPSLDDGSPHRILWTRDSQGNMRVRVDGKAVLSTVEVFYRNAFAGLALVNEGGTYEWGPIRVFGAE
jgi:hypothetical protein